MRSNPDRQAAVPGASRHFFHFNHGIGLRYPAPNSRSKPMRAILALIMIASMSAPAFAQDTHVPRYGEADKEKTASQKAADKAAQEAYKRSLENIPDKGTTDPWGAARSTEAPKPAPAKAAKAKAKPASSADAKQ
jgi:hypothetical protein